MIDPADIRVQEILEDRLDALIQGVSSRVQVIIAQGLADAKGWNYEAVYASFPDVKAEIEKALADGVVTAKAETYSIFAEMAQANDQWAAMYYDAMQVVQIGAVSNETLRSILNQAISETEGIIAATLNWNVVGIVDNSGVFVQLGDYYRKSTSKAITSMLAGEDSYQAAIRDSVREMARSGLRTVTVKGEPVTVEAARVIVNRGGKIESREIYGYVRSKVMDTYRQTLSDMRQVQGREFGADGVEISAHEPCAPDHIDYQGRQFTLKQFDDIQSTLDRPFETSNCKHVVSPVVLGVSPHAYSREDMQEMRDSSEELVTITGLNGEERTMTRYDATQYQRQIERNLRDMKNYKYLQQQSGVDASEIRATNAKIRQVQADYRRISAEAGLTTRPERARAYITR